MFTKYKEKKILKEIRILENEKSLLIKKQCYFEAAVIRDQVTELRNKLKNKYPE